MREKSEHLDQQIPKREPPVTTILISQFSKWGLGLGVGAKYENKNMYAIIFPSLSLAAPVWKCGSLGLCGVRDGLILAMACPQNCING